MRQIERSGLKFPKGFSKEAREALAKLRKLRLNGRLKSDDFDSSVYGPAVKKALWRNQNRKCCWCELKVDDYGLPVEHYRPKTKARRSSERVDEGYWWLAYDRKNLFFACTGCNTKKGIWFPLAKKANPLVAEQHPDVVKERALLIHPSQERPEEHLVFIKDAGEWRMAEKNGSPKGRSTLRHILLDRPGLDDVRDEWIEEHLRPVRRRFAKSKGSARNEARADAIRLCRTNAQYSLLARCYFMRHGVLATNELP